MPPEPGVATGTLAPPVTAAIGSGQGSDFGPRDTTNLPRGASANHPGVDYPVGIGTQIRAADGGRVIFAGSAGTAGNVTVIDHGNGMSTRYLHQSRIDVRVGDLVAQGQPIGKSGDTGIGAAHLHFELRVGGTTPFRRDGRAIDPEPLFGRSYVGQGATQTTSPAARDGALREGDSGARVTALQRSLVARGYSLGTTGPARDGVDGSFGDATRAAVTGFQRDRGLPAAQQTGTYGPITRGEMAEAQQEGWRRPTAPAQTTPTGQTPTAPNAPAPVVPGLGRTFTDTPGPYAAVSTSALFGAPSGTRLGALTADQSYALGRSVLGDGVGARALEAVDRQLGTGSGVFVQRVLAMGQHEGGLDFGRRNPDPAAGYNNGTFQLGGRGSTPESTAARYEALVTRGIGVYQGLSGTTVDRATLNVADRDVLGHIGYMSERGKVAFNTPLPDNQILRDMANPTIRGEALIRLVHNDVQGGIRDIGVAVERMTSPTAGVFVDTAAVEARRLEPDALRREPSMPTIDPALATANSSRGPVYSPSVEAWQQVLAARGLNVGAGGPDGVYGDATLRATQQLRTDAGLPPGRGVVDPAAWAAYNTTGARQVDGQSTPAPPPVPQTTPAVRSDSPSGITETLREGSRGEQVTTLQQHLKALGYPLGTTGPNRDGVDGVFGGRTDGAVERFQRDNGLAVDGVVGRDTRAALPVLVRGSDTPVETPTGSVSSTVTLRVPEALPTPPGARNAAGASYMREADDLVSRVLDRHTSDVPGALAALNDRAGQPGTGPGGALSQADVHQAFRPFATPGSQPLTGAEATALVPVLAERARLAASGVTPETRPAQDRTTGDGATTPTPTLAPSTPQADRPVILQ